MKTFDVQAVEIGADFAKAFDYIANPRNLPEWTNAFRSVSDGNALLETPAGAAEIALEVRAFRDHGTVDWIMRFPDQTVETAYSRLVSAGEGKSIFSFVLMAPKVPLEQLEGTLEQQSGILSRELTRLQQILKSVMNSQDPTPLEELVTRAQQGDREALGHVVERIQQKLYQLALRMLWHVEDARDATQEILVRVITHLASFRGESSFMTWAYRVAANYLASARKSRLEGQNYTFHRFGEELAEGVAEPQARPHIEESTPTRGDSDRLHTGNASVPRSPSSARIHCGRYPRTRST